MIESQWGRYFPSLSRPALGPTQPPVQWVPGFFPGVKSSRGVTLTPQPLLVAWSRKGRATPLLPLWAARPVQSLSACTGVLTLNKAPSLLRYPISFSVYADVFVFVCVPPLTTEFPNATPHHSILVFFHICNRHKRYWWSEQRSA